MTQPWASASCRATPLFGVTALSGAIQLCGATTNRRSEMPSSKPARFFIILVVVSGLAVFGAALLHPRSENYLRFLAFFLAACLAGRLRVKLPGLTGSMSVNL